MSEDNDRLTELERLRRAAYDEAADAPLRRDLVHVHPRVVHDHPVPLRPALGAWAGLLLVAETACAAAGARLSWKTKSISGNPHDEYLSLTGHVRDDSPASRALLDLLDQLETLSDTIDPRTGRMRAGVG